MTFFKDHWLGIFFSSVLGSIVAAFIYERFSFERAVSFVRSLETPAAVSQRVATNSRENSRKSPVELYSIGEGYFGRDNDKAEQLLLEAAEQGYTPAQNKLALLYEGYGKDGWTRKRNDAEAFKWHHTAAEQGYAPAQYDLGKMYERGRGISKSDADAIQWYRKAARNGDEDAQVELRRVQIFFNDDRSIG